MVAETGDRLEKRAYALIIENGYDEYDRFPTLEAAWPCIAPAIPLFLSGDNTRLQTVCRALQNFLNFQGLWDERLALCKKAEKKAVMAADHDNAGWRACNAGFVHYLRQQADALLTCADRTAMHWNQANAGPKAQATAIRLHGIGYEMKKDYPTAIAAYQKSLKLSRSQVSESREVTSALNDLASAEQNFGDLDAAEEHYREALRMAYDDNDPQGVALFTGNLANLALDQEDWLTAETLARKALSSAKAIHRQELIAFDSHALTTALMRQNKAAEALPYARHAVEIYVRLESPDLARAEETLNKCEAVALKKDI